MGTADDFTEGLKTIWAAVHPDVTMSPESNGEETSRTHLYPFKGGSVLTRRISSTKEICFIISERPRETSVRQTETTLKELKHKNRNKTNRTDKQKWGVN